MSKSRNYRGVWGKGEIWSKTCPPLNMQTIESGRNRWWKRFSSRWVRREGKEQVKEQLNE